MKQFLILSAFIFSFVVNSQTKLIAHKSHSGNDATFAISVENDLFDGENFGLGRMEIEEVVNLDSVIYISKDKVIAYSSEYTQRYRNSQKQVCTKDELTKIKKDTLTIKPKSLKKGLTIIEVQAKLDSLKIYKNDLSKTKYIDFDEKSKRKKNRKSIFPFLTKFPNIPNSFFLIFILGFLSVLVYLFASNIRFRKLTLSN